MTPNFLSYSHQSRRRHIMTSSRRHHYHQSFISFGFALILAQNCFRKKLIKLKCFIKDGFYIIWNPKSIFLVCNTTTDSLISCGILQIQEILTSCNLDQTAFIYLKGVTLINLTTFQATSGYNFIAVKRNNDAATIAIHDLVHD